ncbi:hypothetical protein ACFL13_01630 [Patescibacteria group bacterium]
MVLLKKIFEKNWPITGVLLLAAVGSTILHNLVFAITSFEEPFFFIISLLSGLLFLVSFVSNVVILLIDLTFPRRNRR